MIDCCLTSSEKLSYIYNENKLTNNKSCKRQGGAWWGLWANVLITTGKQRHTGEVGYVCLVMDQQRSLLIHCCSLGASANCLYVQGAWHSTFTLHSLSPRHKEELWIWFVPHNQITPLSEGLYPTADQLDLWKETHQNARFTCTF